MSDATIPALRPEALESFRYRRRLLTNRRQYLLNRAALETQQRGKPKGTTNYRLRRAEQAIREYNSLAEDYGLQRIR